MKTSLRTAALSLLLCAAGQAEWRSESFPLVPGWNAIHPFVDATHSSLDDLLEAYPQIEEIWRWQPERLDQRPVEPDLPELTGREWAFWRRGDPDNTTFSTLRPGYGYLVKVADSAPAFRLSLTGRAVLPTVRWRSDGLNLLGFPVAEPPATGNSGWRFRDFLAPTGFSLGGVGIHRYLGGPLVEDRNPMAINPSFDTIRPGLAYWIDLGEFSRYYGPLKVELEAGDAIDFEANFQTYRTAVTNLTEAPLEVTLTLESAAMPPIGPPYAGGLTLRYRLNEGELMPLGGPLTFTLPPTASWPLHFVLDRTALQGATGSRSGSLLRFRAGPQELFLGAAAEKSSPAGLWIGEVRIERVGSIVYRFARDAEGNTVFGEDDESADINGTEVLAPPQVLEAPNRQNLPPVDRAYPLPILVHVDETGTATLLSHVYQGIGAFEPAVVLTQNEALLATDELGSATRLAVAHLPLDTRLPLAGAVFGPGATVGGTVTVAADDPHNPFLHTYHPDHDNLDANFEPLPDGVSESFRIQRAMTFTVDPADPDQIGPSWGNDVLTGTYGEEVSGIYRNATLPDGSPANAIRAEGTFVLRKVNDISALTD